jgi:probable F420-dependent oxidoreductase
LTPQPTAPNDHSSLSPRRSARRWLP